MADCCITSGVKGVHEKLFIMNIIPGRWCFITLSQKNDAGNKGGMMKEGHVPKHQRENNGCCVSLCFNF